MTPWIDAIATWMRRRLDGDRSASPPEPTPSLTMLVERFELTPFERDVLLFCAAAEGDPSLAPTFGVALNILDDPDWDALSPARPLRYWRLIEISQPGATPLTASALRADERIVAYLQGSNHLDDRVGARIAPAPARHSLSLSRAERRAVDQLIAAWQASASRTAVLVGPDAESRDIVAQQAAAATGRDLIRLPAAWLPTDPGDIDRLARLIAREARLLPIVLLVDADTATAGAGEPDRTSLIARLTAHELGPVVISRREPTAGVGIVDIEVGGATVAEQQDAWLATVGADRQDAARLLATQFNFSLQTIGELSARAQRSEDPARTAWSLSLARTRSKLDQLAVRVESQARWRDLILPRTERHLLYAIARQATRRRVVYDDWGFRARSPRGLGTSVLFAGESGTGKTLAAEVIAAHLQLTLYRVDLSAVVSKYIGETEKNLRRLFDAAEHGGTILFFDEADALFGKRSEVKDSHDRYANIEINYLLQRMETYTGLAILATNFKSAIDTAFLRRLRFIVTFPFPGPDQRRLIWRRAFPADAPLEQRDRVHRIDFDRLSRLNLTGGSIHNIAVNAAFTAATRRRRITMPDVIDAVRVELRKLERPISEVERSLLRVQEVAQA
jgi:hypothetical protein